MIDFLEIMGCDFANLRWDVAASEVAALPLRLLGSLARTARMERLEYREFRRRWERATWAVRRRPFNGDRERI